MYLTYSLVGVGNEKCRIKPTQAHRFQVTTEGVGSVFPLNLRCKCQMISHVRTDQNTMPFGRGYTIESKTTKNMSLHIYNSAVPMVTTFILNMRYL